MRMRIRKIILYVIIFVLGFFGVGLWSAWLITHPSRIESGLTPKNFNLPFEEVMLTTRDGLSIAGWFIPAPPLAGRDSPSSAGQPALIILHGYPAEKGDMLFIANALHGEFNILLIDFRYFGKSSGKFTALGNKEQLDLESAVDFIEQKGWAKVGVLGFSLGGGTALMQAEKDKRVAAVVSYASFADLTILGKEIYYRLPLIREALIPVMKFWSKTLWDIDTSISPERSARNLTIPALIVHTKPDEQIPFRHAELLQEALKNNPRAEFYFPENGRHGELPADFEERVKNFFLRYLEKETPH